MDQRAQKHIPVMLREMLEALQPQDSGVYVDATFGAGGYSRAILEKASCRVIAIDRDPDTSLLADALARDFPGHFLFVLGRFSEMVRLLVDVGVTEVDGIVLDLGVSSMQLDQAPRGFSFAKDGPLDMRMAQHGQSAADLIATAGEAELADILYLYGEERASRRLAKAIVTARQKSAIKTTAQLKNIVHAVLGKGKPGASDSATRTFQALRIAVNDELREVEHALAAAQQLLKPGGRLVVVTFHSLEDRIVKQYLQRNSGKTTSVSRHDPASLFEPPTAKAHVFSLPKPEMLAPQEDELHHNPRSRSAKLRYATRTEVRAA